MNLQEPRMISARGSRLKGQNACMIVPTTGSQMENRLHP